MVKASKSSAQNKNVKSILGNKIKFNLSGISPIPVSMITLPNGTHDQGIVTTLKTSISDLRGLFSFWISVLKLPVKDSGPAAGLENEGSEISNYVRPQDLERLQN